MTWLSWLGDNWFAGLQSLAILSGFIFTGVTLRREDRSRRISNLLLLTANHRELWSHIFLQPRLHRVLSMHADLQREPVTDDEALFVGFLVLHLNSAYQAMRQGLIDEPEGLGADIRVLFSHPIPRAVWNDMRDLQNKNFVDFVESHIH